MRSSSPEAGSPGTMLVVTQVAPYADGPAGVHGVLGQAATALAELASLHGLDARTVGDVRDLAPDELARGVLALFTIGETPFDEGQRSTIEAAWRAGDLRVLGVHSATDASHGWPAYGELLGARFDGHPWTQTFEIEVVDHAHPATAHLGRRWSWHDEVYLFRQLRPDVRVLLAAADGGFDLSVPGGRRPDHGWPLAWCRAAGPARTFYTALGHFPAAWENPTFLRHLDGGLSWLIDEGDGA